MAESQAIQQAATAGRAATAAAAADAAAARDRADSGRHILIGIDNTLASKHAMEWAVEELYRPGGDLPGAPLVCACIRSEGSAIV